MKMFQVLGLCLALVNCVAETGDDFDEVEVIDSVSDSQDIPNGPSAGNNNNQSKTDCGYEAIELPMLNGDIVIVYIPATCDPYWMHHNDPGYPQPKEKIDQQPIE